MTSLDEEVVLSAAQTHVSLTSRTIMERQSSLVHCFGCLYGLPPEDWRKFFVRLGSTRRTGSEGGRVMAVNDSEDVSSMNGSLVLVA